MWVFQCDITRWHIETLFFKYPSTVFPLLCAKLICLPFLTLTSPKVKAIFRFLIPAVFILSVHLTPHFFLFSFATSVSVPCTTVFNFFLKDITPLWYPDSEKSVFPDTRVIMFSFVFSLALNIWVGFCIAEIPVLAYSSASLLFFIFFFWSFPPFVGSYHIFLGLRGSCPQLMCRDLLASCKSFKNCCCKQLKVSSTVFQVILKLFLSLLLTYISYLYHILKDYVICL